MSLKKRKLEANDEEVIELSSSSSSTSSEEEEETDQVGHNTGKKQTRKKKKVDTSSKPACPYGAKCYRTSRQHIEEFEHPSLAASTTEPTTSSMALTSLKETASAIKQNLFRLTKVKHVPNADQINSYFSVDLRGKIRTVLIAPFLVSILDCFYFNIFKQTYCR